MILTPLVLAAALVAAPTVVPDPPDPYAWICDSLDAAPTLFGLSSAQDDNELAGDTPIYLTIATASLPASGTLVVDLIYAGA
jgi:hypothetical protein